MPKNEEYEAIIEIVNALKGNEILQEQLEIVEKFIKKFEEQRELHRKKSIEWNKAHPERHKETNLAYQNRNREKIRERSRNRYKNMSEESKNKRKEYIKKYYREVIKPKHQAKKEK